MMIKTLSPLIKTMNPIGWVYLILNLLDVGTTFVGLHAGVPEGNILPSYLFSHYGQAPGFAVKILSVLAIIFCVQKVAREHPHAWRVLIVLSVITAAVVVSNVITIS